MFIKILCRVWDAAIRLWHTGIVLSIYFPVVHLLCQPGHCNMSSEDVIFVDYFLMVDFLIWKCLVFCSLCLFVVSLEMRKQTIVVLLTILSLFQDFHFAVSKPGEFYVNLHIHDM